MANDDNNHHAENETYSPKNLVRWKRDLCGADGNDTNSPRYRNGRLTEERGRNFFVLIILVNRSGNGYSVGRLVGLEPTTS